jgi:quercetin dioxygenase-like cupin family protein
MARAGDVLEDPTEGQRIVFRQTTRETNGALLQFDLFLKPGASITQHIHPHQEERLEVISGSVRFRIGGVEQSGSAGQPLIVPPGTSHGFWNSGGDEAHVIVEFRPALRIETYFETSFGLAQEGNTGLSKLLRMAILLHEYENEVYPAWPPLFVQRILFGLLTLVGRVFGYKAPTPD